MGEPVLKAVVLVSLLIVCVNSQFHVGGLTNKRNLKSDVPSCSCTKIQELMSAELQATNRQLEQLQIAVSDITDLLSKCSVAPTTQQPPRATTKQMSMPTTPVTIEEDCTEVLARGNKKNGVYTVQPAGEGIPVQVYCDMHTEGGGWTVFQRRQDGSVDFYRNFRNYSQGFGDLGGEFWLGNDILHRFTAQGAYELRIDVMDDWGDITYAVFKTFRVGDRDDGYRLEVADYSGNDGDPMSGSNNLKFSTFDQDQDNSMDNCAELCHGAWWFNCGRCAHLNGEYRDGGVTWYAWSWYSKIAKSTEMKIRKKH